MAEFPQEWLRATTEKDAIKLREALSPELQKQILVVGVEMRVSGLPALREQLDILLRRPAK